MDYTHAVITLKGSNGVIRASSRGWESIARDDNGQGRPDVQHPYLQVFSGCSEVAGPGDVAMQIRELSIIDTRVLTTCAIHLQRKLRVDRSRICLGGHRRGGWEACRS